MIETILAIYERVLSQRKQLPTFECFYKKKKYRTKSLNRTFPENQIIIGDSTIIAPVFIPSTFATLHCSTKHSNAS